MMTNEQLDAFTAAFFANDALPRPRRLPIVYCVGDHVFTSHQGEIFKCLVLAVDGDNYTVTPIDNEPGAWQGERHIHRLRPRRYERFTVGHRADTEAAMNWREIEQLYRELRWSGGDWNRMMTPVIECEHCGANANQGDHTPIIDSVAGETTHACGYPQELDF